jgi:sortase B
MKMKIGSRIKNIIFVLLVIICVAVLAVSLYKGLVIYIPQKQEQHRFNELRQIASQQQEASDAQSGANGFADLIALNGDFRGWLKIDGTDIDYPVVKASGKNQEYYLHRDFDKNYSFSGTPFIGSGCDENSDAFIIYAHNMKSDTMFGRLDDYADSEWALKHKDIVFETSEERRVYRVFAVFQTKIGAENEYKYYEDVGNFSDSEYAEITGRLKAKSKTDLGESPTEKTQLLMLSTCSYHTENGRFVVAAYRVE